LIYHYSQENMVLADVITIVQAAKTGVEHVRDWQDDRRDIDAFDAFEQRFIETLETALEKLALSSTFNCPMDEILDRYYDNREQILEQVAEIDIINEQQALDTLVEEMVAVIVKELDEEINQQELEKAVRAAYRETLKKYISDASKDDQLQLRMSRDIQEDVDTILDELTNWKEQLNPRPGLIGRQERFRLLYPATDADWDEVLSTELGVDEEREELAFLPPDGFSNVTDPDIERILLTGRKGSGKSRTLFEGVMQLESSIDFDRVVVVTEQVAQTSDLSRAFQDVDGNALLVFDDLQQSASNDFDLGDALTELEQRINSGDLYVRATTRSEDLDTVLPADYGLNNLKGRRNRGDIHEQWTSFHPERLPPLEGERLEQFVEAVLEFEGVTASAALREEFVEAVVERDPTPFYVTSVCTNAGDRLTWYDLKNLPTNAVDAWYNAYDRLDHDQQTLLEEILVLDHLDIPKRVRVIEAIYESEVFGGTDGAAVSTELGMKGWISERGGRREGNIAIHDIRLEAVESQLVGEKNPYDSIQEFFERKIFFDFSEFLINNRRVGRFPDDIGALLNANFADYVYENGISTYPLEDVRRHFERATELVRESPQIYTAYVQFLGKGHAKEEEIIELYKEAVNQVSNDPELYQNFADIIKRRGKRGQAREVLEDGLEHNPGDRSMRTDLAELCEHHDNFERAAEVLEEGLEHDPGNVWIRIHLAQLWEDNGEREKAIEVLEEGLEHAPSNGWMRSDLAHLWEDNGNLDNAIEVLEEGLEHAPGNGWMRSDLAHLWEDNGNLDNGTEVLEEGLEHIPGDTLMSRALAELCAQNNDLEMAIEVYEEGLKHNPGDDMMRWSLAELWRDHGNLENAIEVYEEGLEHSPGDRSMRNSLVGLWRDHGNLEEAIEVYEEGLEHNPGDDMMRWSLAELWRDHGNLENAIEVYEEGLEHSPGDDMMRRSLAELWENNGDIQKAIEVLEGGLEYNPGDGLMRCYLAELWANDCNHEKAIERLEEGLEHNPGNKDMSRLLAELWANNGERKRAIEVLEESLEYNPDGSWMRRDLGELWEQDGSREKAFEVLEEGLKIDSGDAVMRRNLAVLWELDGDLEKAIEMLEEGLQQAPDNSGMRKHLAELWRENGDHEKAVEIYEEGIKLAPGDYEMRSYLAEFLVEGYKLKEATDKYHQIINSPLREKTIQAEFVKGLESQELIEEANAVRELTE